MPRCLTLTPHLANDELARRYRQSRDPLVRSHLRMPWLIACGYCYPAVATDDWIAEPSPYSMGNL